MQTYWGRFFYSYLLISLSSLCLWSAAHGDELALGQAHSCVSYTVTNSLYSYLKLYCWGDNTYGQLGVGNTAVHRIPTEAVILGFRPLRIEAGGYHTCMEVDVQNMILCWGANGRGQIGIGNTDMQAHPYLGDTGITYALNMATGFLHSCAIVKELPDDTSGSVQCWGGNDFGQLGNGGQWTDYSTPTDVNRADHQGKMRGISKVAAGYSHTCSVITLDTVTPTASVIHCWGSNSSGELGTGSFSSAELLPSEVVYDFQGKPPVSGITAGNQFTCAIVFVQQYVMCWGNAKKGVLGNPSNMTNNNPVPHFVNLEDTIAISAGNSHVCALVDDGTHHLTFAAYCWGDNSYGQLGIGSTDDQAHPAPAQVRGLNQGVIAIAAGGDHTCAIVRGEMGAYGVRCWGKNDDGQLGTGDTRSRNIPTMTAKIELSAGDTLFASTFE